MKPRLRTKESTSPPVARRRLGLLGALALLGVAAVIAGAAFWWRPTNPTIQHGEGFNVILISMDTTRADHLGCYERKNIKTPNLDRLAAEGALFEQCTTVVPLTLPAHTSMMTGTYPFVHGVRNNGHFTLLPENETLAEALKSAGYATGAEVAAVVLNREFGLNQGFDTYHDVKTAMEEGDSRLARGEMERHGKDIADSALTWLRANAKNKFFLFIHFFDPHHPYEPPEPYATQYRNDLYQGEIAFTDEQIGRLLAELKQLGLDSKTLVILTADHGEGLNQHGEETHGHLLYDETIHVPLLMHCPQRIPAGVRVAGQVRSIDIAPTVLDFLGVKGLAQAQGVSLLPLINGAADPGLSAYSETLATLHDFGYSPLRSLRGDGWKLIHGPRPELYEVRRDPGELNDLAPKETERVARTREQLRKLVKDAPTIVAGGQAGRALDSQTLQALQSLGYVGGAPTASDKSELELFEPAGENPRDHIADINLTKTALVKMQAGQFAEAEQLARQLLSRGGAGQENLSLIQMNFGMMLSAQGKYEEAVEHLRHAVKNLPHNGALWNNLGEALARTGKTKEAIDAYRAAAQCQPISPQTPLGLGAVLMADGQLEAAAEQFQAVLQIESKIPGAHAGLARIYGRTSRTAEALAAYGRALEIAPNQAIWRRELAELLLAQGRPQEALQHLQQALRVRPKDALIYAALGQTHQQLKQPDRAMEAYYRALQLKPNVPDWWDTEATLLMEHRRWKEAHDALRASLRANPNHLLLTGRLAWLLATCPDDKLRNGEEAVRLAETVRQADKDANPATLDILAAALAEAGRFEEAVKTAEEALRLAETAGQTELLAQIKTRRELYQAQKPYRLAQ